MVAFAQKQEVKGLTIHPLTDEGHTPFLILDIAASNVETKANVLMYGHMDKQPFGDLAEWKHSPLEDQAPVIEGGKLWGRGSSDDCYAFYSAILAIKAC